MTKYLDVFGHFEQLEFLRNSFKKKFHHSWLIYGTRGIGKKKTIRKFIYWSIAEKTGMKKSEEFNEYLNKAYISSVKEINCEEDNKTDMSMIRKIIDDIQLSNFDNNNFTYLLIDNFDSLNINVKNALLKTIEEPPLKLVIFLIVHNIFNVPRTISSRCINLKFEELNKQDFESFLKMKNIECSSEMLNSFFNYSNGNPKLFLQIYESNGMEIIHRIKSIISRDNLEHLKIKEITELFFGEPDLVLSMVKSFFYYETINLLKKEYKNLKLYKDILEFLNLITIKNNENLNLSIKQEITEILINYFSKIKLSK
tara:strand:+ start:1049 stop:1984 length:936 start_codon:yes stop_codon:yes gene_type:complete